MKYFRGMVLIVLLVGLSACHAGIGIGDYDQHPASVATDGWGPALAQASIGTTDLSL